MKSMLAVLASALLSGCTAGKVWYVDSRFTAEEEQAISAANDMWCTASRNTLCMDLVFGARVDVSTTDRNAIVKSGDRALQYRYRQWMDRESSAAFHHPAGDFDSSMIVVLQERVAPEYLRVAVAHEMGHAYGIDFHVDDPSAIMHKNLDGAESKEALTCADIQAAGLVCD